MKIIRRLAVVVCAAALAVVPSTAAQAANLTFRSELNHKCLELYAFNNANGADVVTWDCWGGANQQWYWDGQYIRNAMNNKCLEIYGFDAANGAKVVLWDCWGGANQKWYRDGQQIRSVMNHKCLEIYAFNNANGAKVVAWD